MADNNFDSETSLNFPNDIQIEMTNNCNLNCKMCPRATMSREVGYLSFDILKKVIEEIKIKAPNGKLKRLQMFKTGEPLVHPDFPVFVKFAKEANIADEICTVSNGVSLTEEKAKDLLNSGIDKITFSIDAAKKDTYKEVKGADELEKVENNVRRFINLKKQAGLEKPFIIIKMIKMDINKDEVEIFKKKWGDAGANQVRIDRFFTWNDSIKDMSSGDEPKIEDRHACLNPWRLCVVDWDGSFVICPLDYSAKVIMGNIKNQSIKEVWNGDEYKKIRLMHINNEFGNFPLCKNCELWRNSTKIPKNWFLDNNKY